MFLAVVHSTRSLPGAIFFTDSMIFYINETAFSMKKGDVFDIKVHVGVLQNNDQKRRQARVYRRNR